ncbi:MAG: ABC transporter substrate-binding protein [Actinomycetota bacterium]|nr:MAG: ABC transporter substrate-binding protein [Actinomycetota bacterium]
MTRMLWRKPPLLAVAATLVLGPALAACGSGASSDSASGGATEHVSVATGAVAITLSPLWIAQQAGYFKDAGVDTTITVAGGQVSTSVTSGQSDIGNLGLPGALTVANQGRPTSVILWELGKRGSGFAVARPGINSITDCKTLATQPPGFGVYAWGEVYKTAFGATYQHVTFGDPPTVASNVTAGNVDCAISTYDQFYSAIKAGKLHLIVDPRDEASLPAQVKSTDFLDATFWGMTDSLKNKREAVTRFVAGMKKAFAYIKTATPEQVADLLLTSNDWKTYTREDLVALLTAALPLMGPNGGAITEKDWTAALEVAKLGGLSFVDPAAPKWSYQSMVDMSYFDAAKG